MLFTQINAERIIFHTSNVELIRGQLANFRALFIWKLDATKNCVNYGIINVFWFWLYIRVSALFRGQCSDPFFSQMQCLFEGSEVIIDGHNVHHISIISGQLLLQNWHSSVSQALWRWVSYYCTCTRWRLIKISNKSHSVAWTWNVLPQGNSVN